MIQNLIKFLYSYKTRLSYNGVDFDADRPLQYREVRKSMAKLYEDDQAFFGPVEISISEVPLQELSKEEQEEFKKQRKHENDLITKGHTCIHQKLKEIRQNFARAVTSGTRSGCGKIVIEFYDDLVLIWGGSPSTEQLPFGVDAKMFEVKSEEAISNQSNAEEVDLGEDDEENYRDESASSKPLLKRAVLQKMYQGLSIINVSN